MAENMSANLATCSVDRLDWIGTMFRYLQNYGIVSSVNEPRRIPGGYNGEHAHSTLAESWLEPVGAGLDAGLLASVWVAELLVFL